MKKMLLTIAIMAAIVAPALADTLTDADGGTLTVADWSHNSQGLWSLTVIWTDTDGNGTAGIDIPTDFSNETMLDKFRKAVVAALSTDPDGTHAPTDNYDIAINKKTLGIDCFQGGANNRDTSTSETAFPLRGFEHPDDTLQLVVSGQSVSGAVVAMTIYVE